MKIVERYGTVLRCYDNGGKTADRYTILPPRWDSHKHRGRFSGVGASAFPFDPQGYGQWGEFAPGPHLGKRVHWDSLPEDVQKLARQSFPEYVSPL